MDLPAIFQRAPDVCLIDELAHTNPPGVEHAKRYEDIEDVLDAGIDVFSTVNVQHLESLNDRVAELTGVRVRETFPDQVLGSADEVVLVDLTPEALIARLRAGKVYPAERVPAALNNFFRVENLAALREVVLRQTAEEVESKRTVPAGELLGTREELLADEAPQAVAERVLALVTPRPRSQRLVRRAWRSSQRLGAELDLLYVFKPGSPPRGEERSQLEALRGLASVLGAAPSGRGGRRPGRHDRARGGRARHHLRADRAAAAAHRPAAVDRVAPRPAPAQAARGRRAHRRRPLAPAGGGRMRWPWQRRGAEPSAGSDRRILFPFIGSTVSQATLEATLRLARAQQATLVPAYLVVDPAASGAGVAGTGARLRGGAAGDGADRAARVASGGAGGLAHRARALAPARAGRRSSSARATTRSSCRRGRVRATASTPQTWRGLLENAPGEVLVLRPAEALREPRPSAEAT